MKATEEQRSASPDKSNLPVAAIAGRTIAFLACLMPAVLAVSGCGRMAPSENSQQWSDDPDVEFDATPATVHQAAVDALRGLSCTINTDTPIYLQARFPNNVAVEVFIRDAGQSKTQVLVKTFKPIFVTRGRTNDVLEAIKKAMKQPR
jgi:hypothetical protein